MNYGHKKVVSDNMELAEKNLREVLMQNGFGVITEINITSPTGMRQIAEYRSPHLGSFFYEQLMKL